jgi:hypothetical protein
MRKISSWLFITLDGVVESPENGRIVTVAQGQAS